MIQQGGSGACKEVVIRERLELKRVSVVMALLVEGVGR